MAHVSIDPKYEAVANEVLVLFKSEGIQLSDYSAGLLVFLAEAWFEDPLQLKLNGDPERRRELLLKIAQAVTKEEHVLRSKAGWRPLNVHELTYAVGTVGKRVLNEILDKGY